MNCPPTPPDGERAVLRLSGVPPLPSRSAEVRED